MKVAIILSGQVRTLAQCWPAWRNVYPDAEVFYYGTEMEREREIAAILGAARIRLEAEITHCSQPVPTGPGNPSAEALLRQWYCLLQSFGLAGKGYDWYIRLRTDLELIHPPEPLAVLDPSLLYLPYFANWGVTAYGGYNDRFAIVPPLYADAYFGRYDAIGAFMEQAPFLHAETFLKWTLRDAKVARTNVVFNTLRANGQRDGPWWMENTGDVAPIPLNADGDFPAGIAERRDDAHLPAK